ncbi:hypothetical protein FJU08_07075 [Martelella alba]|uniref:Uncharacterized protein n=1 Tax=Martelella alba TaxID=2590451 RepID=A0A506UAW9_9HYPH|nr:hypothetical protein [Martelella alba]TPW31513.1 hypothetical protein FJU08_07075 [Martelella alba]
MPIERVSTTKSLMDNRLDGLKTCPQNPARNVLNRLEPAAREALSQLIAKQARSLGVHKSPDHVETRQAKAPDDRIAELRKADGKYTIHYPDRQIRADRHYIFVIPEDRPNTVLVGRHHADIKPGEENTAVGGHVSISHGKKALYAGEMKFKDGVLIRWLNSSGHYRPDLRSRPDSLLPYPARLLPEGSFRPYFDNDGERIHKG